MNSIHNLIYNAIASAELKSHEVQLRDYGGWIFPSPFLFLKLKSQGLTRATLRSYYSISQSLVTVDFFDFF